MDDAACFDFLAVTICPDRTADDTNRHWTKISAERQRLWIRADSRQYPFKNSTQLLRVLLRPDPVCGELYVDGDLQITSGTLSQFMDFLFINGKHWQTSPAGKLISHLYKLTAWCRTINPVARSKRNVAHHYDLTDQLFDLFLDRQRQYSCAYFAKETDDLEMAQNRKIARLAAKLNLTKNHRILDIGCGWGGLATALNILSPDTHVTGITLSEN